MLWRATQGVVEGSMTAGRPGAWSTRFMIQLYIPLELPGRALPRDQAEPDRHREMFRCWTRQRTRWPTRQARSTALQVCRRGPIALEAVTVPTDPRGPSCMASASEIPAGKKVAVVRLSSSRAATLARLFLPLLTTSSRAPSASTGGDPPGHSRSSLRPRHRHRAAGHRALQ